MAYLTKIILPNNLRSESLRSEFLELGQNYNNNHSSEDPLYDKNSTTLKFKFEVRDAETRSTVYEITSIKELLISNDPEFTETSTYRIANFPASTYDPTLDYTIVLNKEYFYGSGETHTSSSAAGTGYFIVENWPLSGNGGLCTVYIKTILYVNDEEVTYPNTGGIFDQIYWAGESPSTPSLNEYSSLKAGWTGKDSLVTFKESNDLQTSNSNSISSYLGSVAEIYNYNNTLNYVAKFASASDNYLSLGYGNIDNINSLSITAHRFYRDDSTSLAPGLDISYSNYNTPCAAVVGTPYNIRKDGSGFTQGFTLDGTTGLTLDSTNNSYYFQSQVNMDVLSLGNDYTVSVFLCIRTSTVHNEDKIITRIIVSDNIAPLAPLAYIYYTNSSGDESSEYQVTYLPAFLIPEILSGGIYETYLQLTNDGDNYIVESYFTPNIDSTLPENLKQKSYLLGRTMMPKMTSISGYYPSIGVYYDGLDTSGIDVTVEGMLAASGPGIIAADLGDCRKEDFNSLNFPITLIEGSWNVYFDEEMSDVIWQSASNVQKDTTKLTFSKLNKYITSNTPTGKQYHEVQFSKPSLSNRASLTFEFQHNCDEMYVAFAPNLLYTGSRLLPLGLNCDPDFALTDQELDHECITVNFSALRNEISVVQRNADNTLSYYVLRSYKPVTSGRDSYTIEITDFHPEGLAGTKQRTSANATWVNIKRNNNVIGFIQLSRKLNVGLDGLGYYCGIGYRAADYGIASSVNYIYKVDLRSLPGIETNYFTMPKSIRSFLLSDKGAAKSKPYLGQAVLNSSTDFVEFNYETPLPYDSTPVNVKCATIGGSYSGFTSNGNLLYVPSSTIIDGVNISTLSIGDYILIKDQDIESQNKVYTIQSLNPSSSTTTLLAYSASSYEEFYITGGSINIGTRWYPIKTGNTYNFYSTTWFRDIDFKYNLDFYANLDPKLLEFKLKWNKPDSSFPQDQLKVRFYSNNTTTSLPDSALTGWIDIASVVNADTFIAKSNNSLVQVILNQLTVLPTDKIWAAFSVPMGCSLAEANGINYNNESVISSGSYKGWNLANNLWFKIFNTYSKTRTNLVQNSIQQFRVSALTHSNLSSHATNLSLPVTIDINAPSYTGTTRPLLTLYDKSTVRTATLKIEATDDDSGILAFRFGKETDYGLVYFEPWQSWNLFKNHNDDNLYTVYLHGSQRYDYAGAELGFLFSNMNIGFSGARKVWVQLMDYAGNISESYPQAFVAQSIAAVDTEAPFGDVSFYNLESNQEILLTNKKDSWLKINASDDVSGIKDFKYRKVTNEGPGEWSNWMMFNSYAPIKFTGEEDGVKRVEVAFRDYGNNITQPEYKWHKVLKVKK
jgi:hypothetical protein